MGLITTPELCMSNAEFGLVRADTSTELLSGREVYTVFQKAIWQLNFSLGLLKEGDDARKWRASLVRLSSFANFFLCEPPDFVEPIYSSTVLQVDGNGQAGSLLAVKNATPNTLVFRAGEYFQIGEEVKMVVEDSTSNGAGIASVFFEPDLRETYSTGTPLNNTTPKIKFRLSAPISNWAIQPGKFTIIRIDAIESFA